MADLVQDLFIRYLTERNPADFLALRNAQAASPAYEPYNDRLSDVMSLLGEGKFVESRDILREGMLNVLLTPSAHLLLAYALSNLGDAEGEKMEGAAGYILLDGILSTGDGSRERPYLVSRIRDEYDVLQELDKPFQGQSLIHNGDRSFDVINGGEGTQLWFDITMMFGRAHASETA
jgi:hypothetical protein